jgi:hypothetical protein
MPIQEHTIAIQIVLRLLMALFAIGVLGGILTNALILSRTKALATLPDEEGMPRGERWGRQFSRSSTFFTESRFRGLRIAMFISFGLCISSFALMVLVDEISK